jgi:hypothetical protein
MSWKYRPPLRSDYDTEEEYQEALDNYYRAQDDYCDEQWERERSR